MKSCGKLVCTILLALTAFASQSGVSFPGAIPGAEAATAAPATAPLLRIETGQHTALISRVDLDSSGHWLVSASHDKTVRVWDTQTGRLDRVMRPPIAGGNEGKLYAVAISPDGALVACGGWIKSGGDSGHSVFIFAREDGRLLGRIDDITNVVLNMAFSPDGKYLALTLGGKNGVRIYQAGALAAQGRKSAQLPVAAPPLAGQDHEYGDSSYGISFSKNGSSLVTSCDDGYLRLYDLRADLPAPGLGNSLEPRDLVPQMTLRIPKPDAPFNVKFSPDATKIAVSFSGSGKAALLQANDLSLIKVLAAATTERGAPSSITWSRDGAALYTSQAGGHPEGLRGWSGAGDEIPLAFRPANLGMITDLAALPDGSLVIASNAPSLTIQRPGREQVNLSSPEIANFRDNPEGLLISPDGSAVRFGYQAFGALPGGFSLPERTLTLAPEAKLAPLHPVTRARNLQVTGWNNGREPSLNGRRLPLDPNEFSRALAISGDSQSVLIGGDWYLRRFDSSGKELWKVPSPGAAWALNISADGRLALAAYGDGTIRWHRMSDGRELLAFFPHADRKRWIVWTPEGFFDRSPGGEELIGFHLNRDRDQAAEFIPVSKLYNQFYRPDLVDAAFEGKDISAYARAIDIRKILTAATLPPKVRFITKSGSSTKPEIEVAAELCPSGGGIGDVTIYLNNMPITFEHDGKQGQTCHTLRRKLSLANGDNVVSLMAYNADNTIESQRASITISHSSALLRKPDLYILTIAVDKYRDGSLQLNYSNADADAVAESLRQQGGRLFGKIVRDSLSDGEVTREKLDGIFSAIGNKSRREDMFVMFVAGHGLSYDKDGSFYFLPVDFRYSDDEDVPKQGISMNDFKRYLARIQATKSLLLLDTCNSGSFAEAIGSRGILEKTAINKLTRAVGRHTLVASSKSQLALEGFQGHGAFSWVLLDGMKGKAANTKGEITVNSLVSFVEATLPELTFRKWGYEQIPQKSLQGEDFPFALK